MSDLNPVHFVKAHPLTSGVIGVGIVAVAWFVFIPHASAAPAGNSGDYFLQGPSDAQIASASNLAVANAQISSQERLADQATQAQLSLAAYTHAENLSRITASDAADSRANNTSLTTALASLQTQLAGSINNNSRDVQISTINANRDVSVSTLNTQAAINAANQQAITQRNASDNASDDNALGFVGDLIGGIFDFF